MTHQVLDRALKRTVGGLLGDHLVAEVRRSLVFEIRPIPHFVVEFAVLGALPQIMVGALDCLKRVYYQN